MFPIEKDPFSWNDPENSPEKLGWNELESFGIISHINLQRSHAKSMRFADRNYRQFAKNFFEALCCFLLETGHDNNG